MRRYTLAGLVPAFVLLLVLAGCSGLKYDLYEMAISHERGAANLTLSTLTLDDGLEIAYLENPRVEGQPHLVLIHGFAANKDNWLRFAAELTGDFHIVAVDLPGHGDSTQDPSLSYGIEDQVEYLHRILKALDIPRAHLAGNSMGGAIAALYAATYPQEVASLALFDPAGVHIYESELTRLLAKGENPLIVEKPDDFDRLMDFALEDPPFVPWPITSVLAEKAAANREINQVIFEDLRNPDGVDVDDMLGRIQAPTLVIWGAQDRVIDVRNADVFEQLIPGARKVVLEGIGHAPMIEAPERTATLVRELAGQEGVPAATAAADTDQ